MLTSHYHRESPCNDGDGDIVLPPSLPSRAIPHQFPDRSRAKTAYAKTGHSGIGRATVHPTPAPQNCTPRVKAPSTTRFVPVMKLAARLARNTTAFAISCGVPMRPVGLRASAVLYNCGLLSLIVFQTPPSK